jgi:hypothetical protein
MTVIVIAAITVIISGDRFVFDGIINSENILNYMPFRGLKQKSNAGEQLISTFSEKNHLILDIIRPGIFFYVAWVYAGSMKPASLFKMICVLKILLTIAIMLIYIGGDPDTY